MVSRIAALRLLCVAALAGSTAVGAASCAKGGHALSVDLRTDLVPGTEFQSVVTKVDSAHSAQHGASESATQFLAGTRVADFSDLADGNVTVQVTLVDPEGTPLVGRTSTVTLKQDFALTVVVTRSCAGVICPEPAGDPALTTCQAGHCTNPSCTPDTPEACPTAECATDGDCRTEIGCLAPRCDLGVCLFPPNDALCPQGQICDPNQGCVPKDGQPACTPTGAKETNCGDGVDDDCDGRVDCLDDDCAGMACEDGDACTAGETCQQGACSGGAAISCDDNNPCTDDGCDPKGGCTHANNTAPCEDGDACTTGDVCDSGACKAGQPTACDDGNPCTDDTCNPQSGCAHANNAAPCDDGTFCNGADTCSGGACAVHPGSPCAMQCDEASKKCVGCLVDADCGAVAYGAWGTCGGFASTCATDGTQSRTVTTPRCQAGVCVAQQTMEMQACTRTTDGASCGSPTYGSWSTCGGFAGTCDTSGTQSRSVTSPTCQAGACTNVASMQTQACSRVTNGDSCGTTKYGAWGACGGFSSACDTTGTQSRSVTTYACSAGACATTSSSQSQSCTRTVANGTSCGGSNYCCGGSCVAKSSNSHCGACGVVCSNGHTCGSPVSGQWDCHCTANSECVGDGYGSGATCYTDGTGSFCNCQCPGGATSCSGLCAGGATCHDVSGQNYCSYP